MLTLHNNNKAGLAFYLAQEAIKNRKKKNTQAAHDGQITNVQHISLVDSRNNPPANMKLSPLFG